MGRHPEVRSQTSAETIDDVSNQMTFRENEPRTFHRFLDKFRILDEISWTEALIDDSIRVVCDGLEEEGIDFAWMDFSINKYMKLGWHKHEAVQFVYDAFQRYRPGKVGLILSLKYESMRASQRQYAKLIEHENAARCLIGIDLVGDETYFDVDFYAPLFREWRDAKKLTRAHVTEFGDVINITRALQELRVTNIAHGIKVINCPNVTALAKDMRVTFDVAITSNDLTGTWQDLRNHPAIIMLRSGLRVTLGSDDPVQCSTTLDREFMVARNKCGWTAAECHLVQTIAMENSKRYLSE
jgi:adenosine deaminase